MSECSELSTYKGDDLSLTLEFKDALDDPVDITGWTVFFTAKKKLADPDEDAVLSSETASHADAENGITAINISHTETDEVPAGTYFFDIQYKDEDGRIATVLSGSLKVSADVTRRIS